MLNDKYIEYIRGQLDNRTLYEQLAEESAELAQASLKLIRALGHSCNYTPKTSYEAYDDFVRELRDLAGVITVLYGKDFLLQLAEEADLDPKLKRWAKRLGYKEETE